MRVELREFEGEDLLLFFPEDGPESMALDMLGKPGDRVYGQLRLADGYGEYYMMFKTSENPVGGEVSQTWKEVQEALRQAEHSLTTLSGLYAADGLDIYEDALQTGHSPEEAWELFKQNTFRIDESPVLALIKEALPSKEKVDGG